MSHACATFADVAIEAPRRYGSTRGCGVESSPTRRGPHRGCTDNPLAPPSRYVTAAPRVYTARRPYQAPTVDESR